MHGIVFWQYHHEWDVKQQNILKQTEIKANVLSKYVSINIQIYVF